MIRDLYELYYKQLTMRINGQRLQRLVTIGDLKSCDKSFIYLDRSLLNYQEFIRQMDYAVNGLPKRVEAECGVTGMVEVYGTTMWFLNNGERGTPKRPGRYVNWDDVKHGRALLVPIGQDIVIDFDRKDNKWMDSDEAFIILNRLAGFMRDSVGIEPDVLVGNGVQLRVTVADVYLDYFSRNPLDWAEAAMNVLPSVINIIVDNLVRHFPTHANLNIELRYDAKMYDPARITRLDYSPHAGLKAYSLAFKPHELLNLTWSEVRWRQASEAYVRMRASQFYTGRWGRVVDPAKFRTVLETFLSMWDLNIEFDVLPPAPRPAPKPLVLGGWRRVTVPGIGIIEYDKRLDGFGWIEVLVKGRIPIRDGRLTMAWLVLPVAIKGPKTRSGRLPPLISIDEALNWLRVCIERYPSDKGFEAYKEKLLENLEYGDRYNAPTWGHLLLGVDVDGNPLSPHYSVVRDNVFEALVGVGKARVIEHTSG